ncbi:unnamed protein product [Laminaria digitata]
MASLFDNTTLSGEGIRSLIRLRGGLPPEHRFTAWKYLLRLPGNSAAFAELVARGPHPAALASLATRYPVRDRKAFRKTAVLISALAHWSPILAEVEFVPSWVFPFVVVFSQDDLGAFEAAMSFLLHWGSRLLSTFPQPPVPVLAGMELALRRADAELAAHLASVSVGALSYGWPLLRSAFSEVLAREDWLRLVDRVLASADRPQLLEAAAVGFAVASRSRLLPLRWTEGTKAFFRRRQSVDLREMFRVMERVAGFGAAPEGRGGGAGGRRRRAGVAGRGDVDGTMAALALLGSVPCGFKPLPVGAYPHFDGFPQFVVNYQAELRERVAKQEREMETKRRMVEELGQRAKSIVAREDAMERAEEAVDSTSTLCLLDA